MAEETLRRIRLNSLLSKEGVRGERPHLIEARLRNKNLKRSICAHITHDNP